MVMPNLEGDLAFYGRLEFIMRNRPILKMKKSKKIIVQEELERRILHGLASEWENALYVLSPRHRQLMKKPLFSLWNLKKKLGCWSGEKHEICLSRDFVLNCSWGAVREVLLHETAHQFAETVLGAEGETPHGPAFQEACRLLRADPAASKNYGCMGDHSPSENFRAEDKILLRVKKLMALAGSRNPHEAEAAMAKAHELILKYNITLISNETARNFRSRVIGAPALRHTRDEYRIAGLLQDFYFVQGIWISAYVLEKGRMGRVLEISGTAGNVQIADYVYSCMKNFIHSQWIEYNEGGRLSRYRRTDFAAGVVRGFRSKLECRHEGLKNEISKSALIEMKDPLLREYMKFRYPHTACFSRRVANTDQKVIEDGVNRGKKLLISKGIEEKEKNMGRLISAGPFGSERSLPFSKPEHGY